MADPRGGAEGGLQVLEAKGDVPLEVLVQTRRGDHGRESGPSRSYTAIVLGNYDLPGASAIYRKLMEFLAAQ